MLKITQPRVERIDPAEEKQRARSATISTLFKFGLLVTLIRASKRFFSITIMLSHGNVVKAYFMCAC
uniref:Uncharacterized protein n=1 Tax=Rhipicephalus microplus TaxID=6941 RepID=A0A6G5AJF3_RHIMP